MSGTCLSNAVSGLPLGGAVGALAALPHLSPPPFLHPPRDVPTGGEGGGGRVISRRPWRSDGVDGRCVGDCECTRPSLRADLPLASANSDIIGWSRVLLSQALDAARSY